MRFVRFVIFSTAVLFSNLPLVFAHDPCRLNPPISNGGYAPTFVLTGEVETSKTFDLKELEQYAPTKLEVVFGTGKGLESGDFTGVLLWDLLKDVGIVVDPTRKNDLLRKHLVVTASDGYQTVLSLGEIVPDFGGQPVLVAYERDGQLLGNDQGMARLVVPGDKKGGRYVSWITQIAVCGITSSKRK